MRKRRSIIRAGLILIVLGAITASFFLGSKYALEHLSITKVAAFDLGQAMKADHFYRSYRENTLLVVGTVGRLDVKTNKTELVFAGTEDFEVRCSMISPDIRPAVGSPVTLITEAARAIRLPHGVLLNACTLL